MVLLFSFGSCASSNGMQQDPPKEIGDAYFQQWTAGVQGGGAGYNVYIPIKSEMDNAMQMDSIYFRGMVTNLEKKSGEGPMLVGHFKTDQNTQKDIILSSDPREEAKNELPPMKVKVPFEVKDNECIVSYKVDGKTKYFVIRNLKEKAATRYPRAREN